MERLEKVETENAELRRVVETERAERLTKEVEHAELLRKFEEYAERLGKAENELAVVKEFAAANVACASGAVVTDPPAATSLVPSSATVDVQSRSAPEEAPFIPVRNGARPS